MLYLRGSVASVKSNTTQPGNNSLSSTTITRNQKTSTLLMINIAHRTLIMCRPVFLKGIVLRTKQRKFMLLLLSMAKVFSYLHIRQKTEAGKPKMCSASDVQIVKNVKTVGGSLAVFGWALLCYVQLCIALQSVGCTHYEFLLHPLTGCRGGEPTGNFSAIQTHNRPCSMAALACTFPCLSPTQICIID